MPETEGPRWPLKVSVLMVTYNHERYIGQAIESVLNQKTSFDYEIVIGEDCSTDGTRDLVAEYARNHPEKIRALLAPSNQGGHRNFLGARRACRGQYIAVLDGDDFWTSPAKLQKQADFLDQHQECSLCFHRVTVLHADGTRAEYPGAVKEWSGVEDILHGNFIPTPSAMLRNGLVPELPAWVHQLAMGDWPMWVLHAVQGDLGFINEVMAAYRLHSGGMWSSLPLVQQLQHETPFLHGIDAELGYRYHGIIKEKLYNNLSSLALNWWEAGEDAKARACAWESFRMAPFYRHPRGYVRLLSRLIWSAGHQAVREGWRRVSG